MINALYDLLFEQEGTNLVSRLRIDVQNNQDVTDSSKEARRELQTAIEVMASLTSCARSKERPFRAQAMLMNFARGHALIHERRQLTEEDLPRTAQLAVGSMPEKIRLGFTALIRAGGSLMVNEAASAVGCSIPTARDILKACDGEVMEFVEQPQPARLRLRDGYGWCIELEKWLSMG